MLARLLIGRWVLAMLIPWLASVAWAAPGLAYGEEPPRTMTIPDRLAPPKLPANPTQADLGAKVYYDYCLACHGDRGQGLNEDWLSAWAEGDRNCWQSRCHAANHPPGGFVLPRTIPPVIGERHLAYFGNAENLYLYIRQRMPWHMPGSLAEEQYWQLTAYLARANGLYDGNTELTADSAVNVRFLPESQPTATVGPEARRSGTLTPPFVGWMVALLAVLIAVAAGGLLLRRGTSTEA